MRRPPILLALAAVLLLGGCGRSPSTPGPGARAVAREWVRALNRSDVRTVARLACPDEGFRASEVASARSGTKLGPYTYSYLLRGFRQTTTTRATVQIVQRLTSTLRGARRVSDLPGTFNVVRRAGAWLVCPAGVER